MSSQTVLRGCVLVASLPGGQWSRSLQKRLRIRSFLRERLAGLAPALFIAGDVAVRPEEHVQETPSGATGAMRHSPHCTLKYQGLPGSGGPCPGPSLAPSGNHPRPRVLGTVQRPPEPKTLDQTDAGIRQENGHTPNSYCFSSRCFLGRKVGSCLGGGAQRHLGLRRGLRRPVWTRPTLQPLLGRPASSLGGVVTTLSQPMESPKPAPPEPTASPPRVPALQSLFGGGASSAASAWQLLEMALIGPAGVTGEGAGSVICSP